MTPGSATHLQRLHGSRACAGSHRQTSRQQLLQPCRQVSGDSRAAPLVHHCVVDLEHVEACKGRLALCHVDDSAQDHMSAAGVIRTVLPLASIPCCSGALFTGQATTINSNRRARTCQHSQVLRGTGQERCQLTLSCGATCWVPKPCAKSLPVGSLRLV